jgi:hypothetical protein
VEAPDWNYGAKKFDFSEKSNFWADQPSLNTPLRFALVDAGVTMAGICWRLLGRALALLGRVANATAPSPQLQRRHVHPHIHKEAAHGAEHAAG